jgi:T-complex protein 1 subunit beta
MQQQGQPQQRPPRLIPKIFDEEGGAEEAKGEHARMAAFMGALAVADIVKTTLGPKGMDKLLMPMSAQGKVTFTNDGATILKSIPIENPAAKILIDTSKTQDEEIGDGTTSVCVLAGELLREAQDLIAQHNIHPQTILRGWRKAIETAKTALQKHSIDNSADPVKMRDDLYNIARTTLSSKILASNKEFFADLAVTAVMRLKGGTDLSNIQIIKKMGGTLADSYLDEGFILDKKIGVGQPRRLVNPKILVANTSLDTDKIKITAAKVQVKDISAMVSIETAEREKMKTKVEKILAHDCNCFISRQLIYNYPEQMFTAAGVMAVEHADFEGVERLSRVLGAEIVSTFDTPHAIKLGECKLIEEIMIGEDRVLRFSGVAKGEACSIVIRGATRHILEEAERSIHDALCILTRATQQPSTVWGGGCAEVMMAKYVDELALNTNGKEAMAIEAFSRALRKIPMIIADNAGFDSSEIVSQLKTLHYNGNHNMGIDILTGKVGDVSELKITESLRSKMQSLVSAHEAAEVIMRVVCVCVWCIFHMFACKHTFLSILHYTKLYMTPLTGLCSKMCTQKATVRKERRRRRPLFRVERTPVGFT